MKIPEGGRKWCCGGGQGGWNSKHRSGQNMHPPRGGNEYLQIEIRLGVGYFHFLSGL